jgi:hypothetical protein
VTSLVTPQGEIDIGQAELDKEIDAAIAKGDQMKDRRSRRRTKRAEQAAGGGELNRELNSLSLMNLRYK